MRAVVIPSRVHCKNSEVKFRKSAFSGSRPFFWSSRQMDIFAVEYSVQPCCFWPQQKDKISKQLTSNFGCVALCCACKVFITHEKKERIERSSKKNRKKNLQEMMLPAVKIFQGVKPVISMGFFSTARLARKSTSNGRHLCSGDFETGLEGGPICHQWSLVRFASVDSVKFGFI